MDRLETVLRRLKTPLLIQEYLDTLKINFEKGGDTHWGPNQVVMKGSAHCIEAATLAAAALWAHGRPPLLLDLKSSKASKDVDHVVALYKTNGYWGAISKSNHATIRWRDPVYRTVRELALSYYHEWFPETGEHKGTRTLASYSRPVNLAKYGKGWMHDEIWWIDEVLDSAPHYPIAPAANLKSARRADKVEIKAGRIHEY